MANPVISVVMATCNQAATLPEALSSLWAQTLPPDRWELIVINDGSTDATEQILSQCIHPLRTAHQPHQGLVSSCNAGLRLARGEYFARIDSDDSVSPDWLERICGALEAAPEAVCAVPDRYECSGEDKLHVQVELDNLYSLIACGTLFRTELLRTIGGYHPLYWEEYDLYLRLRAKGRFLRVDAPLYTYRRHASAMTQSRQARQQGWRELAQAWGEQVLRNAGVNQEMEESLR